MYTPRRASNKELVSREAADPEGNLNLQKKLTGNWVAFLQVDLNKQELFIEIAENLHLLPLRDGTQVL